MHHRIHSSVSKIAHTLIHLIVMIVALDLSMNWPAIINDSRNNYYYYHYYHNGYVFVLVNSPKLILKSRFLVVLNNNCHSKPKRINDRKEKRKNQTETASIFYSFSFQKSENRFRREKKRLQQQMDKKRQQHRKKVALRKTT